MKQDTEIVDMCMSVIKGTYSPGDLDGLADRLESSTIKDIREGLREIQAKPLLLIRVMGYIELLASGSKHDTEYIKRRVVAACRDYTKFEKKVRQWESDNGGEGAYAKATALTIKHLLRTIQAEKGTK